MRNIWEEVVLDYLMLISQHSLGELEEFQDIAQTRESISGPKFEPGASRYESGILTI
jgi:hypothetical protein